MQLTIKNIKLVYLNILMHTKIQIICNMQSNIEMTHTQSKNQNQIQLI